MGPTGRMIPIVTLGCFSVTFFNFKLLQDFQSFQAAVCSAPCSIQATLAWNYSFGLLCQQTCRFRYL